MALNVFSRIVSATVTLRSAPLSSGGGGGGGGGGGFIVSHDRRQQRFTVAPGGGSGARECAVLQYRVTGDKEVELMSTYVPEAFRSRGVAAALSQAAMEFLLEENLKARVSCWYIKKYIEENPEHRYKDLVIA